ncbi:unnamed protein product [Caenorhabditis angaria]|uniref:Uncharacterized protein n=1 Tax=Caenorhabditis angaria TaxID=860376 RepID=A0A9P1IPN8_9PELO|nr:unnamed protein product [Caenorhabditis angaria]
MSSWTVLDKTDNTLTIVLRRGEKKKSKKTSEDSSTRTKKSSKKRKHRRPRIDNDKLDENTEKALRSIREINKYLKHKYQIRSDPSSRSKTVSTSISSTATQTPKSTSSEDVADKMYREVARIPKIAEAVDHKGYPLSHPLATTPFPGATTAAQREKARQMLRNLGRQQEESKKSSKKSSTKTDLCKRCHTCSGMYSKMYGETYDILQGSNYRFQWKIRALFKKT